MNRNHIMAILALALCTVLCLVGASALTRNKTKPGYECWEPAWMTIPEPDDNEYAGTITPIEKVDISQGGPFSAQYLRTNGYHEGIRYPIVKVIHSAEELNKYYESNKGRYEMGAFQAACEKYDEDYFKDHILLMVLTEAGSGSVRYQVRSVTQTGSDRDGLTVAIDVIDTGFGTCDMAEWHILIEPATGIDVSDEANVKVEMKVVNPCGWPQNVTHTGDSGRISLRLPENWYYEVDENGGDGEVFDFTVRIGPKGYDGYPIVIGRETSPTFGVCGTGLEQKKIRLGAYEGWQGTYDGHPIWDFIILGTVKHGRCVILNDGFDETWWVKYGAEAMEILSTLETTGTTLTREEAIEAAQETVTVPYDLAIATFSEDDFVWTVDFYREDTAGGDQTVTLDAQGNIIGNTYGE